MVAVIASRSAWCRVRFRSKEIQPVIPHIEVSSCHSCCKRSWGRRRYSINQRVAGFSAHRKISSFETETRCLAADPSTCFKSPCATALIHAGRQPPHVSATQRLTTVDSPPRLTIPGGFTSDDASIITDPRRNLIHSSRRQAWPCSRRIARTAARLWPARRVSGCSSPRTRRMR